MHSKLFDVAVPTGVFRRPGLHPVDFRWFETVARVVGGSFQVEEGRTPMLYLCADAVACSLFVSRPGRQSTWHCVVSTLGGNRTLPPALSLLWDRFHLDETWAEVRTQLPAPDPLALARRYQLELTAAVVSRGVN